MKIILLLWGLACAAHLGVRVATVVSPINRGAQQTHERDRIVAWVAQFRGSPPPGMDGNSWNSLLGAVHNSLYNCLRPADSGSIGELRALADNLERTPGRELRSAVDVFRFMLVLEETMPAAEGYGPFATAREEFPTEARAAGGNPAQGPTSRIFD